MLCRNPDGLFWAGDTAQTITVGNTFRFTDLRSLVHRKEVCSDNFCMKRQLMVNL